MRRVLVALCLGAACAVAAPEKVALFSLEQVRLLDGPFRRAEELNRAYLLSIDPDRLLYHFRVNAELPTTARPYGGWEAPDWDFYGHTLGHYLTACAQMTAHGDEPEFRRRVDYIVAELAKCQAALASRASHPGFLDPLPESVFERMEQKPGGVGVPFYTMHKTLAGLLDAHQLAHNRQALDVLLGMADWLQFRLAKLSDEQVQAMLRIEHGGIAESFASLYAITHDPNHRMLAERLNHRLFFEPFARGEDPLGPGAGAPGTRLIHANTQVPKAIAAAREYEVTGRAGDRDVAVNFWRTVALGRSFIIGGNSDQERFFERGTEAQHLTARTAEFCNTYNMLKLTRHLFAWEPTAELMDFYERALYNHVLAAQNPHTGMTAYFTSLEPGGRKRFGTPDNTFWCCTGTGMEMESRVADAIYAHDDQGLYVNLFIASELRWAERGLVVTQRTRFPASDRVTLTFATARPQRFALRIRLPAWTTGAEVAVNGTAVPVAAASGSYATIEHEWADGDRVEVRLPMVLRAVPLADDPTLVAFLYGPLVLAGDLGDAGLRFLPHGFVDNGKDPRGPRPPEPPVFVPGLVTIAAEAASRVRPVDGAELTFVTQGIGQPQDMTLRPLYAIVENHYSVYWRLYDAAAWRAHWGRQQPPVADRAARIARMVDAVWFGLPDSEAAHAVDGGEAPVVSSRLSLFRDATNGWVSCRLQVPSSEGAQLEVGYLEGETAAFDIEIEGKTLASERPARHGPVRPNRAAATTIKTYPVPAAMLPGRATATLRFVGHVDQGPARIVYCRISRP